MEAAALGKPALCTRVEGVEEVLGASDAQICNLDDVTGWSVKCVALMEDEALRTKLGCGNQERVLNEFTVERTTEKYVRLWLKLALDKGIILSNGSQA